MKKKGLLLLIILIFSIVGCSKKDDEIICILPELPQNLLFEDTNALIECVENETLPESDEDTSATFEEYQTLLGLKERGSIPVLVNAEGEPLLDKREGEEFIEVFYTHEEHLDRICYRGLIGENTMQVTFLFLDEELLELDEEPTALELFPENEHEFPQVFSTDDIIERYKQLADRRLEMLIYDDITNKRNHMCFVYDNLLVILSARPEVFTNEFFAQLDIGYIEIE